MSAHLYRNADRRLGNLRSHVRRGGLTGWVKHRDAFHQYRLAYEALIELEDVVGVDAAGSRGERLRALRIEAQDAGLLTPEQIIRAEHHAVDNADTAIARRAA